MPIAIWVHRAGLRIEMFFSAKENSVRSKSIVWTCAVAMMLCSAGLARADFMNVPLYVGGSYTSGNDYILGVTPYTNQGGGNITPSTLDYTPLVALYCVDIPHDIGVPFSGTAEVNTSGIIGNDASNNPQNGGLTLADSNGLLMNAGNIGYLLQTYGGLATSTDQQEGLQAAIWKEVYGSNFTTQLTGNALSDYNSYIGSVPAGGNASYISQVYWINPSGNGSGIQGLVGNVVPINPDFSSPEPASLTLLGTALVAFGGFGLRRRRQAA
jgi:hypothetical protein